MGNMHNSNYDPQEREQCVTWYNQAGSSTTLTRNFRTRYQIAAMSRKKMLNSVEKFELRGIGLPQEDFQLPRKSSKMFRATFQLILEDLSDKHKQISRYLTTQHTKF